MKLACCTTILLLAAMAVAEPPAGEWKVVKGEWKQPTKTSWQTTSGVLSFAGDKESDKPIRLTANLIVLNWGNGGLPYIAIMWAKGGTHPSIRISQNSLRVGPWGVGFPEGVERIAWKAPSKQRIGIALQITNTSVTGSIGGQKIKLLFPESAISPLEILVADAEVLLDNLSVR